MQEHFSELALLLIIAAACGALALRLRQPVLIAYIVVGIVVGPALLGFVTAHDQIDLLAQMGIAVLLFLVGLKLDLAHVRHIGPVALATGLGQLAFTIAIGFLLVLLMGRTPLEALYVAVALTFSSTIIIVKLLSDKREIDSLHGRIAVGFLIVQDLAVVLAMMVVSAMGGAGDSPTQVVWSLLWRVALAAAALYLLMRYLLPRAVALMARSQELLLIFAIAWGVGLAALGDWAGFSKEAGAFLAGFSLASTRLFAKPILHDQPLEVSKILGIASHQGQSPSDCNGGYFGVRIGWRVACGVEPRPFAPQPVRGILVKRQDQKTASLLAEKKVADQVFLAGLRHTRPAVAHFTPDDDAGAVGGPISFHALHHRGIGTKLHRLAEDSGIQQILYLSHATALSVSRLRQASTSSSLSSSAPKSARSRHASMAS
jgi:hypothetical protein